MISDAWISGSGAESLSSGMIHIWKVRLPLSILHTEMHVLLSDDEAARAARYAFDKDRNAYVYSRGVLRTLLSHYCSSVKAADWSFIYNNFGKPSVEECYKLYFNLSHSKEMAVFAFCRDAELGIDIEARSNSIEWKELSHQFFSAKEVTALHTRNGDHGVDSFYRCWTRKEAFIKALGQGLSIDLNSFSVSIDEQDTGVESEGVRQQWSLPLIECDDAYTAALAYPLSDAQIQCYEWDHQMLSSTD